MFGRSRSPQIVLKQAGQGLVGGSMFQWESISLNPAKLLKWVAIAIGIVVFFYVVKPYLSWMWSPKVNVPPLKYQAGHGDVPQGYEKGEASSIATQLKAALKANTWAIDALNGEMCTVLTRINTLSANKLRAVINVFNANSTTDFKSAITASGSGCGFFGSDEKTKLFNQMQQYGI